jgi:cephalosporin hydroxylase
VDDSEGLVRVGSVVQEHLVIAEAAVTYGACQKTWELAEFIKLVAGLEPDVIVEVGVEAGGTLYAWKQLAPTVIGIDIIPSGPDPVYCSSGQPRNQHGATMIIGDSHDPANAEILAKILDGRLIDFLFIDGDHRYDGVCADYELYAPLVRSGGLIGFHDISAVRVNGIDVPQFWAEIKDETAVEIVDPNEHPIWPYGIGFGIGVLRVP